MIVGRAGQGKTTLFRKLLRSSKRALVFDTVGIISPGLIIEDHEGFERWLDSYPWETGRFRVIYRPTGIDESNFNALSEEANYLCFVAREIQDCEMFFDECDTWSNVESAPPMLIGLLNTGRRRQVSLRAVVRRPQVHVAREFITEATRFSIFRTVDPGDANFIERYTGIPNEEIRNLKPFHYYEWTEGGDFSLKRIVDPYS